MSPENSEEVEGGDMSEEVLFVDHFSLGRPSSTITFRGAKVHVYGDASTEQFLVEERVSESLKKERVITVKRVHTSSFGLRFLRITYSLVALIVGGFLFVFCFQMLLFLIISLPVSSGFTSGKSMNAGHFLGAILTVPLLLYSMASAMAMATTFVVDTWRGGPLLRSVMHWGTVTAEWVCFLVFLGVPSLTIIITLMKGLNDWWEVSARVWVWCVFLAFCAFAIAVFLRELTTTLTLTRILHTLDQDSNSQQFSSLVKRAFLLSQAQRYAGFTRERYLVSGHDEPPPGGYALSPDHRPQHTHIGLYTHLTQLTCCSNKLQLFETLDPPRQAFSLDKVRDAQPFLTTYNWSLEKMCCSRPSSRSIAAASGPAALKPRQAQSSFICSALGSTLVALIIVAALLWLSVGASLVLLVAFLCVVFCLWPMVMDSLASFRMYQTIHATSNLDPQDLQLGCPTDDTNDHDNNDVKMEESLDQPSSQPTPKPSTKQQSQQPHSNNEQQQQQSIFHVTETLCVTKPRPWFCVFILVLELVFFFFWPLVSLYANNNAPLGTLFLVVGLFSLFRIYFDASALLTELGAARGLQGVAREGGGGQLVASTQNEHDANAPQDKKNDTPSSHSSTSWDQTHFSSIHSKQSVKKLLARARMAEIVGKITRNSNVPRWMWFFGVSVALIFILFLSAVSSGSDVSPQERPPIVLLDDFYYPPQPQLQYPSCDLTKGFTIPGYGSTSLSDYAFLSALAYEMPEVTEPVLEQWFGPNAVVDQAEFVAQYRRDTDTAQIPVWYKFFTFPQVPGLGVVSIRGSQTSWDWLVNMQLWSSSALTQLVRAMIPFGWLWTPVMDDIVTAVNLVESESIKQVSYYTATTKFVNDLMAGYGGTNYTAIRVTGASLGGGLAMITGAQTGASAVAISGPAAELARHTYTPPVTMEQLNSRVFNVIPDRDIIARLGGRAPLFQKTQCRAPNNDLFGCHSMWRSVCELIYTCGSNGRPALCMCAEKFDYPFPQQNGTRTFEEACKAQTPP